MMRSCSGLTFMLCTPSVVSWRFLSDVPEDALAISTRDGRVPMMRGGDWQCQAQTANPAAEAMMRGGSAAPFDLVLADLPRQRVPVDAEGVRSFREAAVALSEDPRDEALLELADGVLE